MPNILAIESSCDETAAAVIQNRQLLSHIVSSQLQHGEYGGVIPELASRLHQQNIIAVVQAALEQAEMDKHSLDAIAFTQGPGLLGALLVGTCFAKAYALALELPLIGINHMEAHVLANFLQDPAPAFPFLCLTVSGGHTQLVLVKDHLKMEVIGQSIDDAAGEAFDKAAKLMGLPYPGGPLIDKHAQKGNINFYNFPTPEVGPFEFSFSGLKTSLLYLLKRGLKEDPQYIEKYLDDVCASYQHRIVTILIDKLEAAAIKYGVNHLAIAGGVAANSWLRTRFHTLCERKGWKAFVPPFDYCTDNAGMIAIAAHFKYEKKVFSPLDVQPYTRA